MLVSSSSYSFLHEDVFVHLRVREGSCGVVAARSRSSPSVWVPSVGAFGERRTRGISLRELLGVGGEVIVDVGAGVGVGLVFGHGRALGA